MKNVLLVVWTALVILATIAIFTKPSYKESLLKIIHELNSRGYQAGVYYKFDGVNHNSTVQTAVTIKDRLFYRDIYFPINGQVRKIAIAAFGRLYLVN